MACLSRFANLKVQAGTFRPVCVSVYGRTIPDLKKSLSLARSFDPGFIELRLDYLHSLLEKIPSLPATGFEGNEIVTYRARDEGGEARVSDDTRRQILLEIISKISPPMIDVEARTLEAFPEVYDLLQKPSRRSMKLIASSHNFEKTEDEEELMNLVIGTAKRFTPSIVKVVRWANDFDDNLRMLSLYRLRDKIEPSGLIAFCAGPLGIFSRISCVSYGSPFTFASLPNRSTAKGQLDITSMIVLLDSWD